MGPLVRALRPRTGTPGLVDSLRNGQAGEQQAPRKIQAQITSGSYAVGEQRLERPNIVLGHRHISSAAANQDPRSGVINRGGQMAAEHEPSVDCDRVSIAKLFEGADRRRDAGLTARRATATRTSDQHRHARRHPSAMH